MSSAAIPGAAGLPVPSIEQLPVHFSVAARRHPLLFPERLCKIKRIGVSGIFRNFIDLQIRILQQYIENYCLRNGIRRTDRIFPITERAVQKQLAIVCDYLGFEGISTHSFRKWYATEIYKANGYDIALVQRLLQHSSAAVTQRYIGIEPQRIEAAIQGHVTLL